MNAYSIIPCVNNVAAMLPEPHDNGLPHRPRLSSEFAPTPADLLLLARYIASIATDCNIHAKSGEPMNPWTCIGALRFLTGEMVGFMAKLAAEEERNLLLMDRLRHEANQEAAHERLMATDSDYAEDFEAEEAGEE